jgi:hypothetical protein
MAEGYIYILLNRVEVKVQRAAIVLHLADGGCPDPNAIADDIPASHGFLAGLHHHVAESDFR